MNETTPKESALPGTPGGGEGPGPNPNCRPRAIRPVHTLPPRRYAGEAPPSEGPSEAELACRAMRREYRRMLRGGRSEGRDRPYHPRGRGVLIVRVLPEIDPARIELGDDRDQDGSLIDEHGRRLAPHRSPWRGVYWDATNKRWRAQVHHDGRYHNGGSSRDEETAARMRDALALRLFGESAVLNFPLTPAEGGGP